MRISRHLTWSTAGPAKKLSAPIEPIQCMVSTTVGGWPVSRASSRLNWSLRSSSNASTREISAARSFGGVVGQGPWSKAARAAATAASTSAAAASGVLPTYSPVAGQCTSMTSEVDGAVHLPPMNSVSYSVFRSVFMSVMRVTLPKPTRNENRFHYLGLSTSTRLLTRNSRSIGTDVNPHAQRGW